MIELKSGERFIHKLQNGEGMLYEVVEDPINPVRLVKTLSPSDVQSSKQKIKETVPESRLQRR